MRPARRNISVALVFALACAPSAVDLPDAGDVGPGGPLGLETQTTACARIGGLDRLVLTHVDYVAGQCVSLTLVAPNDGTMWPELKIEPHEPFRWGVEFAARVPGESCDNPFVPGASQAETLRGTVTLHTPDGGFMPTTLDLDVTFGAGLTETRLRADNVVIAGNC